MGKSLSRYHAHSFEHLQHGDQIHQIELKLDVDGRRWTQYLRRMATLLAFIESTLTVARRGTPHPGASRRLHPQLHKFVVATTPKLVNRHGNAHLQLNLVC